MQFCLKNLCIPYCLVHGNLLCITCCLVLSITAHQYLKAPKILSAPLEGKIASANQNAWREMLPLQHPDSKQYLCFFPGHVYAYPGMSINNAHRGGLTALHTDNINRASATKNQDGRQIRDYCNQDYKYL